MYKVDEKRDVEEEKKFPILSPLPKQLLLIHFAHGLQRKGGLDDIDQEIV